MIGLNPWETKEGGIVNVLSGGLSKNGPPDPWKIILMIIDSKDYLNYDSIIFYVVRNTNSRHKLEAYITKYFK